MIPGAYPDHSNSTNCYIVNNTIINADQYGIKLGFSSNSNNFPDSNYFYNNLLHYNPVRNTTSTKYIRDIFSGICELQTWKKNFVTTDTTDNSGSYYAAGITYVREHHLNMNQSGGSNLYRLSSNSNARNQTDTIDISLFLRYDMDYESRGSIIDIGADEYSSSYNSIALTASDVGVSYSSFLPKSGNTDSFNNTSDLISLEFQLKQNYPNPFNPTTNISYQLLKGGNVKINVYNVLGELVRELLDEYKDAGSYTIQFNASKLPSGIYLYKIWAGEFSDVKSMLFLK